MVVRPRGGVYASVPSPTNYRQRSFIYSHAQGTPAVGVTAFLHDFQLPDRKLRVADAVGWDLQQALEQRNAPTDRRRDDSRPLIQVAQMGVPSERHEDVRGYEQQYCRDNDGHLFELPDLFIQIRRGDDAVVEIPEIELFVGSVRVFVG